MPTHHTHHCPTPPDAELDLDRTAPLRYDVAWPDGAERPGLILLIPGFGQDNDDGYLQAFRGWVAERFGLACLTVRYHGSLNRPAQGAERQFAQPDLVRLAQTCIQHGIPWPEPPANLDLMQMLGRLDHAHNQRNAQAQARGEEPESVILTCGLRCPDGPINLGLPQALDHLAALADLRSRHAYDPANVIALGSSHGGYLAQLINKLAPNTLRAVFDNSGYADPPLRYIDSRSANAGPDFFETHSPTFRFAYYLMSAWTHEPGQANTYHEDAHAIRNLAHPAHLKASLAAAERRVVIRCIHAPDDPIAPTDEKQAFVELLKQHGVDATLRIATPEDVDGRFIKSLDHGLGLSLRKFFQSEYEALPPFHSDHRDDAVRCTQLEFGGVGASRILKHTPDGIAFE
ncbi:MAG: DUF2920 family protein [Planctomycetota bacterium]